MEPLNYGLAPEFLSNMQSMLGKDFPKYLSAMESQPVRGLRVNTKKVSVQKFLKLTDLPLEQINFARDGFVLNSQSKLGLTPEHLAGLYYLQEPSSMLAVCAANLKKNSKVLDLCASPGGKTSQIACRVGDSGVVFSNEVVASRTGALFSNVERQGFENVVILNESPENLSGFKGYFDYVFVDAPCSGEGMFRKNPETINEWNLNSPESCKQRQIKILNSAAALVKPEGLLIYSTCTFSVKEDEEVVKYIIDNLGFELLDVDDEIKKVTKPANLKGKHSEYARKFFPFTGKGEGQFVAVLKKVKTNSNSQSINNAGFKKHYKNIQPLGRAEYKELLNWFNQNLEEDFCKLLAGKKIVKVGNTLYALPNLVGDAELSILDSLKFVSIGVRLGEIAKARFEPNHSLFMAYGEHFKIKVELGETEFAKYLHGEQLNTDCLGKGYAAVTSGGYTLGGGKLTCGKLKNLLPKALRIN